MQCALVYTRMLVTIPDELNLLPFSLRSCSLLLPPTDLLRLRTEEPNMDLRTLRHLPLP